MSVCLSTMIVLMSNISGVKHFAETCNVHPWNVNLMDPIQSDRGVTMVYILLVIPNLLHQVSVLSLF